MLQSRARPTTEGFDQRLESLRGIAALAVVITHALAVVCVNGHAAFWKLSFSEHTASTMLLHLVSVLFNANAAVVQFFVLSGYVLTLSVQRLPTNNRWTYYAIRRAFRLLPPMWVSILVAWVVVSIIPPQYSDLYTEWYKACFTELSKSQVLSNFVLADFAANPGTWTMYVEAVGSICIPFLVLATTRLSYPKQNLLFIVLALLTVLTPRTLTLDYLVCFQAGVMIAINPHIRLIPSPVVGLWIGVLVFMLQRLLVGSSSASIIINTLGSIVLIQGVRAGAIDQLLQSRPLRALGRCSYSLYLTHLVVLYLVGNFIATQYGSGLAAVGMIVGLSVPLSIALAQLGYYWVEQPSIAWGKRIALLWGKSSNRRNPSVPAEAEDSAKPKEARAKKLAA
jgi:peptidoglycan/LPS O-acetylase OafA/YrhL